MRVTGAATWIKASLGMLAGVEGCTPLPLTAFGCEEPVPPELGVEPPAAAGWGFCGDGVPLSTGTGSRVCFGSKEEDKPAEVSAAADCLAAEACWFFWGRPVIDKVKQKRVITMRGGSTSPVWAIVVFSGEPKKFRIANLHVFDVIIVRV